MGGVHEPFAGQIGAMSISVRLVEANKRTQSHQSSYLGTQLATKRRQVVTGAVTAADFAACCPFALRRYRHGVPICGEGLGDEKRVTFSEGVHSRPVPSRPGRQCDDRRE